MERKLFSNRFAYRYKMKYSDCSDLNGTESIILVVILIIIFTNLFYNLIYFYYYLGVLQHFLDLWVILINFCFYLPYFY